MNYYLPNPNNLEPITCGEMWFFDRPHWKLAVMLGYDWKDDVTTKDGFSFFNNRSVNGKRCNDIFEFLDKHNIKYTTEYSNAGWQYKIKISKAKKYLTLIDELYNQYYNETLPKCKGLYKYNDHTFIDQDSYNKLKSYRGSEYYLEKY